MKLLEVIEEANSLRPNAIDDYQKVKWVYELEGEVADMMRMEAAMIIEVPSKEAYATEDTELLMPYPYDNVYALYVMAKIDLALEETDVYQNDMMVFNDAMAKAKKWWFVHKGFTHKQSVHTL